jgi:hypothetical protein
MTIYFLLSIQTPGSQSALQNVKFHNFSIFLLFIFFFLDPDFTDSTELGSNPDPDPNEGKRANYVYSKKVMMKQKQRGVMTF